MPTRRTLALVSLFALLPAGPAPGADAGRPRIGLVLSGGGARGGAHVGVLRQLEALRIPIDVIAGTSMGAFVGGLYATGMTAEELSELFHELDWDATFRGVPPRELRSFRRKRDDDGFLVKYRLWVRDGELVIPRGATSAQNLKVLLEKLTIPVAERTDFDDLPIPFRAVAADIETGDEVVIASGDLSAAIISSMSIPGIFPPVELGGRLLVDGGVANNLPVDVARAMGADVVIAVDVGTPYASRDELDSAFAILDQVSNILVRKRADEQVATLGPSDVLITPALGDISLADYGRVVEAMEIGREAAEQASDALRGLAVSDERFAELDRSRREVAPEPPVLEFVRIEAGAGEDSDLIASVLDTEAGEPIDPDALERDLARVYALDRFESVDFDVVQEDDRTGLVLRAKPREIGRSYLRFGLNLEDDFEGDTSYTIAASFTATELNRLGGEWRTDLRIGERPAFATELYQPLDARERWFVAPTVDLGRRILDFFQGNDVVARFRVQDIGVGLSAGRVLGNWGEVRAGIERRWGDVATRVGDPDLEAGSFDAADYFVGFTVDTLDDVHFPHAGTGLAIRWTHSDDALGADEDFHTVEARWLSSASWGRNTLLYGANAGSVVRGDAEVQDFFPLGGFLNLSGFRPGELAGRHAGLARVIAYRQIAGAKPRIVKVPLYLGGSFEAGGVWRTAQEISFDSVRLAGSVFLGLDTALGPIYLAGGFAEGGNQSAYLFLGQSF